MTAAVADFARWADPDWRKVLVLIPDNVGWHVSGKLAVPANVVLRHLPPSTPHLQPVERLWPLVREALANETFPTLAARTEPLAKPCRWLAEDTVTVKGAVGFHWAVALGGFRFGATWSTLLPAPLAKQIDKDMRAEWKELPANRRGLLHLLSRFELSLGQVAGIDGTDADMLADPYQLTILPPSVMRFAASRRQKNDPFTTTANSRSNSSSPTSATGFVNMIPALFTRMSSLPNAPKQASNSRFTSATLLTSACTATAFPPAASMRPTVCWACWARPE